MHLCVISVAGGHGGVSIDTGDTNGDTDSDIDAADEGTRTIPGYRQ